jgi:hypothetical protein
MKQAQSNICVDDCVRVVHAVRRAPTDENGAQLC